MGIKQDKGHGGRRLKSPELDLPAQHLAALGTISAGFPYIRLPK
jgi:hypothetical protein